MNFPPILFQKFGVKYHTGEVLFWTNEKDQHLFVIYSGKVKVFVYDEHGRENVFAVLEKGEIFGEMAIIEDAPRSANVVSIGETECLKLSKPNFLLMIKAQPEFAITIMKMLSQRLRHTNQKNGLLSIRNNDQLIATYIYELAKNEGIDMRTGHLVSKTNVIDKIKIPKLYDPLKWSQEISLQTKKFKNIIDYMIEKGMMEFDGKYLTNLKLSPIMQFIAFIRKNSKE